MKWKDREKYGGRRVEKDSRRRRRTERDGEKKESKMTK